MKIKFLLTILFTIYLFGCSSVNDQYKEKLDFGLKSKVNKNSSESISFFGKCNEVINDDIKTSLEKTGIQIQTISKDIFTASGSAEQIIKLAKLEVIKSLEESKERFPKK
jgi:starvation-inducible outer membrane lipoprotein